MLPSARRQIALDEWPPGLDIARQPDADEIPLVGRRQARARPQHDNVFRGHDVTGGQRSRRA
jgi:hypothetical protein